MNITYNLSGRKLIKKLSVRFYHNKLDLSVSLNVMLMDNEWDSVNQIVVGNDEVTIALLELKGMVDEFSGYSSDEYYINVKEEIEKL